MIIYTDRALKYSYSLHPNGLWLQTAFRNGKLNLFIEQKEPALCFIKYDCAHVCLCPALEQALIDENIQRVQRTGFPSN